MNLLLSLLFCVTLLAGCTADNAYRYYGTRHYAAVPAKQVEVLHDAPAKPYEVIADFQCRGGSAAYLRGLSAKIGADAVIVTFIGGYYDRAEVWAGRDSMTNTAFRSIGTAIKYKETP